MATETAGDGQLSPLNTSRIENMTYTDVKQEAEEDLYDEALSADDLYYEAIDETLWQGFDRMSVEGAIKIIHYWADEKEYFDIYQMSAFDSRNGRKKRCNCRESVPSAIICLILQLPSIIFLICEMVMNSDKDWCNLDDVSAMDGFRKFLAFGYSAYLASFIQKTLNEIGYKGMYVVIVGTLNNLPPFLSGSWLRIGCYYNVVVLHFAIYASFAVIFFSDNIIDLVLNSVALFFITEIDDYLVSQMDYNRVKIFIEDYLEEHENDKKNAFAPKKDAKCVGFWKVFECILDIFQGLIYVLSHLAPFYIGVCS